MVIPIIGQNILFNIYTSIGYLAKKCQIVPCNKHGKVILEVDEIGMKHHKKNHLGKSPDGSPMLPVRNALSPNTTSGLIKRFATVGLDSSSRSSTSQLRIGRPGRGLDHWPWVCVYRFTGNSTKNVQPHPCSLVHQIRPS